MSADKNQSPLQDWHREDIKAALRKRGITMAELARRAGYSTANSLRTVFDRKWPKAQRIVAAALDITPQEIWPSRYHDITTKINIPHRSVA